MTLRVALNQGKIPISNSLWFFFFFFENKAPQSTKQLPQYVMKRHLQAVGMCRIHLHRPQSGKDELGVWDGENTPHVEAGQRTGTRPNS